MTARDRPATGERSVARVRARQGERRASASSVEFNTHRPTSPRPGARRSGILSNMGRVECRRGTNTAVHAAGKWEMPSANLHVRLPFRPVRFGDVTSGIVHNVERCRCRGGLVLVKGTLLLSGGGSWVQQPKRGTRNRKVRLAISLSVADGDVVERVRAVLAHPIEHGVGVADDAVAVAHQGLVSQREERCGHRRGQSGATSIGRNRTIRIQWTSRGLGVAVVQGHPCTLSASGRLRRSPEICILLYDHMIMMACGLFGLATSADRPVHLTLNSKYTSQSQCS